MTKIKVLQYRADMQDGHLLDDAISAWTWIFNPKTPPYSHSEICFSDGLCFSSTTRERGTGKKFVGTRFEDFEIVTRHKNRWDVYEKKVTTNQEKIMLVRAKGIGGRRYYFVGIFLDFFLPFGWISAFVGKWLNQWYCSQAVYYCLTGERKRISPRRLTNYLLRSGFAIRAGGP
jgi:hypothetical protein